MGQPFGSLGGYTKRQANEAVPWGRPLGQACQAKRQGQGERQGKSQAETKGTTGVTRGASSTSSGSLQDKRAMESTRTRLSARL